MLPSTDKMIFLDIIIDDDSGEKDEGKDIVPYQLSKEAVVMDMKVQDITVRTNIASFPGSCVGEEEREPDTHCLRMRQVPLVTCILLCNTKISVYLLKGRTAWLYFLSDTYGRY